MWKVNFATDSITEALLAAPLKLPRSQGDSSSRPPPAVAYKYLLVTLYVSLTYMC